MTITYLNGDFLPIEEARISVLDRGFLFGDGVYEVIPAYGGRLFRLKPHLQRLQRSLDAIRVQNPLSDTEWADVLNRLLEENRNEAGPDNDQSVYLQVTRGVADKRDHPFPSGITPTVYASSSPIRTPDPALAEQGISAVTLDDIRWQYCHIKAITLLPNVLLRQQAVDAGVGEAILVRNGLAMEGSASNLFVVKDGILITPPISNHLLPGITRDLVLELAAMHGIPFREADVPENMLKDADEVWVTSSTREIMPVTTLDGTPVGDGKPGPLWKKMIGHYREYKDKVRRGLAE